MVALVTAYPKFRIGGVKVFFQRRAQGQPRPNLVRVSPPRQPCLAVPCISGGEGRAPLGGFTPSMSYRLLHTGLIACPDAGRWFARFTPLLVNPVSVKRHHPAPIEAREPFVAKSGEVQR